MDYLDNVNKTILCSFSLSNLVNLFTGRGVKCPAEGFRTPAPVVGSCSKPKEGRIEKSSRTWKFHCYCRIRDVRVEEQLKKLEREGSNLGVINESMFASPYWVYLACLIVLISNLSLSNQAEDLQQRMENAGGEKLQQQKALVGKIQKVCFWCLIEVDCDLHPVSLIENTFVYHGCFFSL